MAAAGEPARAPLTLCPDCMASLSLATGVTPGLHTANMLELCRKKGFNAEARQYLRMDKLLN